MLWALGGLVVPSSTYQAPAVRCVASGPVRPDAHIHNSGHWHWRACACCVVPLDRHGQPGDELGLQLLGRRCPPRAPTCHSRLPLRVICGHGRLAMAVMVQCQVRMQSWNLMSTWQCCCNNTLARRAGDRLFIHPNFCVILIYFSL